MQIINIILSDIPWNFFRRPTPNGEQDQNLALAHCQQKLQGYDFVANIDFDEFIVQSNLQNVKEYFKVAIFISLFSK